MKKMLAKSLIVLSLLFTLVAAGNTPEAVVVAEETSTETETEPLHNAPLPDHAELNI